MRLLRMLLALVLFALLTPLDAAAKDRHPAEPDSVKVGMGVPFTLLASLGYLGYMEEITRYDDVFSSTSLRVPILLPGGLRIEPEFGYLKLADDDWESSGTKLVVGVHPTWSLGAKGSAYAGGRIGVYQFKSENDWNDDDGTDKLVGLVGGGEHWISRYFTIGAEAQVTYIAFDEDDDMKAIATGFDLMLRFYFM